MIELPEDPADAPDDPWTDTLHSTRGGSGEVTCDVCGGVVVAESFDVPCCGPPYSCVDWNERRSCSTCQTYSYDW